MKVSAIFFSSLYPDVGCLFCILEDLVASQRNENTNNHKGKVQLIM